MKNYLIEDNIDFYKLLTETLEKEENTNEISDQNQKFCLITQEPLTKTCVKLKCGHTFNYKPLYNEIYNYNYSNMILNSCKSTFKPSIKCPYCRCIQNTILPYYPEVGVLCVYGINSDDKSFKLIKDYITNSFVYENTINYVKGKCCYVDTSNEKDTVNEACNNTFVVSHNETQKTYCCQHISVVKKMYIAEQKQQQKTQLKQKKMEEKQKKMVEKQKEKMELKQKKMIEKQNISENTIISVTPVIQLELDVNLCCAILKTGLNKGKQCTYKICNNELKLCKKHCSYKNINNIENNLI
jgi:hypothetical protein